MGGRGDSAVGGGGSGAVSADEYAGIMQSKVSQPKKLKLAETMVEGFATKTAVATQTPGMDAPEDMVSLDVLDMKVSFGDGDGTVYQSLANIMDALKEMPKEVGQKLKKIALAKQKDGEDPFKQFDASADEATMTHLGGEAAPKADVKEAAAEIVSGGGAWTAEALEASAFGAAYASGEPSPVEGGGGGIVADWKKSVSLYTSETGAFKATHPQRAAAINSMLS